MNFILGLLIVLSLLAMVGTVGGLLGLPFKKVRRDAGRIAGASFVVLLVALFTSGRVEEKIAQQKGYETAADEKAAESAGFKNASDWVAHKKTLAEQAAAQEAKARAEEAARQAKARVEEETRQAEAKAKAAAQLAQAQAAGFSSFDDYQSAKALGINAVEWKKRAEEAARQTEKKRETAARLDLFKKLDSSIQTVEELDTVNGLSLDITIMTRDVDARSFYKIGDTIAIVAKQLREIKTNYALVRVLFRVPVSDKYGNDTDLKGGHIFWKVTELNKVNLDAGLNYIFRVADTVYLRRFGGEMAREYCQSYDFRDPRYCVRQRE